MANIVEEQSDLGLYLLLASSDLSFAPSDSLQRIKILFFRSQMIWSYTVCKDKVYLGTAGLGLIKIMHKFLGSLSILLTQCKFLVILLLDGCF